MPARKKRPKTASLQHEYRVATQGYLHVVGLDEAGRGAWAGPVAAGAVCLPPPSDSLLDTLAGVRDSKEMTPNQRERLALRIQETARAWGVGSASAAEIDAMGIVPATKLAMGRAIQALRVQSPGCIPDYLFLDAMIWADPPVDCPQWHAKRADQASLSVAAASVLAKVWRDDHMRELDAAHPGYEFARHKGYGTARHRLALAQLGPAPVHRRSFRPIQMALQAIRYEEDTPRETGTGA